MPSPASVASSQPRPLPRPRRVANPTPPRSLPLPAQPELDSDWRNIQRTEWNTLARRRARRTTRPAPSTKEELEPAQLSSNRHPRQLIAIPLRVSDQSIETGPQQQASPVSFRLGQEGKKHVALLGLYFAYPHDLECPGQIEHFGNRGRLFEAPPAQRSRETSQLRA